VIRDLRGKGAAILFVSHFLEQVYEISDRITVLRNGKLVGEYLVEDLPREELVTKMIGKQLDDLEAISETAAREIDRTQTPVLKATDVGRRGVLEPADLDVFEGEIVGIAGLLGSGRTELVRLLYGADRADSGQIEVGGEAAKVVSPRHAIDKGISFSSEDRRAEGIVSDLTVAENIVLGLQARKGFRKVRRSTKEKVVAEYMAALDVRPANPGMVAGLLSGGNQQKVLIARWLATAPELLILDEPTRGIDVGTKADLQRKVAELSEKGLSVIFISSELEEVLRLAQRVVVMRDRKCIGELDSQRFDLDGLVDFIANEGKGSAA
jgi:simple sugar transport system ATP-binding protein